MNLEDAKEALEAAKLNGWDSTRADEVVQYLIAEVERLKGLVALVEFSGPRFDQEDTCPWCFEEMGYSTSRHLKDCPAFTPEGEVR